MRRQRSVFSTPVEQAYGSIGRHRCQRSRCCGDELKRAGWRSWPLTRHSYLVFCIEQPDHIAVWRVLRGQREIPVWMREADER